MPAAAQLTELPVRRTESCTCCAQQQVSQLCGSVFASRLALLCKAAVLVEKPTGQRQGVPRGNCGENISGVHPVLGEREHFSGPGSRIILQTFFQLAAKAAEPQAPSDSQLELETLWPHSMPNYNSPCFYPNTIQTSCCCCCCCGRRLQVGQPQGQKCVWSPHCWATDPRQKKRKRRG